MLASALRALHSVNASGCPFKAYRPGETLVHGDACLPNFMCQDDGIVNGYIDLAGWRSQPRRQRPVLVSRVLAGGHRELGAVLDGLARIGEAELAAVRLEHVLAVGVVRP
jgi:hypothetical protein